MIRLTDDYYIDMDERNYILCFDYKRVDKKGNRVYRPLGYFGRMDELLDFWAERVVKQHLMNDKDELTISEAVEIIRRELEIAKAIVRDTIPDITVFPIK